MLRARAAMYLLAISLSACSSAPHHPPSEFLQPLDLVCKSQKAGGEDLVFHVIPGEDGDAIVARMNAIELVDFQTQT